MNKLQSLMILIVFMLFSTACVATRVQPGERGLMWRASDGLEKEALKDGVYWTAPWNDVYRYDVRWQSYKEEVDAWSSDNLQVAVKAALILRPIPDDLYYLVQTVGPDYYERIVEPEFLAAVRSVVAKYPVVMVPEKSAIMAKQIQQVVEEKLQHRHLIIQSVAIAEVDFPQTVKTAIEVKQAKEQEKEQKEFELLIASKEAEIARARAKGEGDSIQIRAEGQAKAQETITKTLTPEYLRYKLYDGQTSKLVLLPDDLKVPVLINPGEQPSAKSERSPLADAESSGKMRSERDASSRGGIAQ